MSNIPAEFPVLGRHVVLISSTRRIRNLNDGAEKEVMLTIQRHLTGLMSMAGELRTLRVIVKSKLDFFFFFIHRGLLNFIQL